MDKQAQNEAALSPTRPLSLGRQVYACRAPTLADLAAISAIIRKRAEKGTPLHALVSDPAYKLLPLQAQVEAAKVAAQAQVSGARPLDGLAMAEALFLPDVLAFAVWTCCRSQHDDLALAEIRVQINEENAGEVFLAFNEASGMLALSEGNAAGPSPSLPRQSGTGGPWSEGASRETSQR